MVMSTCLSNLVRVIPIDEGMMRRIRGGDGERGLTRYSIANGVARFLWSDS